MRKSVLIALLALGVFLPVFAEEFVMKIGTEDPAGKWDHHGGVLVESFMQEVSARSNGRIKIEYYPNKQLGNGESMLAQTRRGILQVSLQNDGVMGSVYAPLQVLSIPYLFADREVAWQVLDGPFGQKLADDMAKQTGLRVLTWTESGGFRHFTNSKREIRSPADMRGMKIRTMNLPLHMQIVKDLGASPTPISWSELYTSLQTGVADGQENAVSTFRVPKLEEVQKYMTLDGHVYSVLSLVINEKWFNSLPDDLKDVVRNSMAVATVAERGQSVIGEFVGLQALKAQGLKIYKPSNAEKKMFRDATQESAIQFLRKDSKVGARWVDEALSSVESVEKKLGYR